MINKTYIYPLAAWIMQEMYKKDRSAYNIIKMRILGMTLNDKPNDRYDFGKKSLYFMINDNTLSIIGNVRWQHPDSSVDSLNGNEEHLYIRSNLSETVYQILEQNENGSEWAEFIDVECYKNRLSDSIYVERNSDEEDSIQINWSNPKAMDYWNVIDLIEDDVDVSSIK